MSHFNYFSTIYYAQQDLKKDNKMVIPSLSMLGITTELIRTCEVRQILLTMSLNFVSCQNLLSFLSQSLLAEYPECIRVLRFLSGVSEVFRSFSKYQGVF